MSSLQISKGENVRGGKGDAVDVIFGFRERVSSLSLDLQAI